VERNHKTKESFVVRSEVVWKIRALLQKENIMAKETDDKYYADEIRMIQHPDETWWVGIYGINERRKDD